MQYSIENDILRLTVDSHGAEPVSGQRYFFNAFI